MLRFQREAVPSPDPLPRPAAAHRSKLKRAIRWVALFALAVAGLAVSLVSQSQDEWRIHMMIATGVGAFLTVLLAGALMLLVFFSSSSGHDESVAHFQPEDDQI
jgi:hypothetical protein